MTKLAGVAKLRAAMIELEGDLGLKALSQNERDVLYAFEEAGGGDTFVSSDTVRHCSIVSGMAHATFHRALRSLLESGHIEHAPNSRTKHYRLSERATGRVPGNKESPPNEVREA